MSKMEVWKSDLLKSVRSLRSTDEVVFSSADTVVEIGPPDTSEGRPAYNDPDYWDNRYAPSVTSKEGDESDAGNVSDGKGDVVYEWIVKYSDVKSRLAKFLDTTSYPAGLDVLHTGCGNSTLGCDLRSDLASTGVRVVNCDYSSNVIDLMRGLYPSDDWEVLDCLGSAGEQGVGEGYDRIVDKCVLDAFTCGGTEREKRDLVGKYLDFCLGCLRVGGRMIVISFGQVETRGRYFKGETHGRKEEEWGWGWGGDFEVVDVEGGGKAYVYELCKKI